MKKLCAAILALLLCNLLAGCCREHEWKDATCMEPRTCVKCGETEGETAAHTWRDATCTEAKTCSFCGLTEGEALAHHWMEADCATPKTCALCGQTEGEPLGHGELSEANYQQGPVCQVCGQEVGEPLPAAFQALEVEPTYMELGETYPFTTHLFLRPDEATVGDLTVAVYETFPSDETHPEEEGYEWRRLQFALQFDGKVAQYGPGRIELFWDYYADSEIDMASELRNPFLAKNGVAFSVNWYGQTYSACLLKDIFQREGNTLLIGYEYRLPVGYDGMVFGFADSNTVDMRNLNDYVVPLSELVYDGILLFRLS